MAYTLSRNLKLRLDSNLTANSRYNLERLDLLGSTFLVDTSDSLRIRSISSIEVEPNSADIGGSGSGGDYSVGSASHILDNIELYGTNVYIGEELQLPDQASGGTKRLLFQYKSDLNGSTDTTADRILRIDLEGSNRNVVLGGDFWVLGNNVLKLNTTADTDVTLPLTGVLATLANSETFTNKTINASNNTILNIADGNIAASAGIQYSKLNLSNSIVNADVNSAAAIAYSKLNLAGSITNADISNSASIAYSKLLLAGSIVNADISGSANIDGSKIDPNFGNQEIYTADKISVGAQSGTYKTSISGAQSGQSSDLEFVLPPNSVGGVLQNDGSGNLSWVTVTGVGTVTSVGLAAPTEFSVSGSPITAAGTLTLTKQNQSANQVWAGPTSGGAAQPSFRALVDADLPSGNLTVDHSAVSINTAVNSGLSGGGNITASRSLLIDPTNAPSVAVATGDILLFADVSNSNSLSRTTVADIVALASGSVSKFSATWTNADGTTKVVTHSLGTKDIQVEVYDMSNDETIQVDSIVRTDTNNITLTSSSAPAVSWRVVITG